MRPISSLPWLLLLMAASTALSAAGPGAPLRTRVTPQSTPTPAPVASKPAASKPVASKPAPPKSTASKPAPSKPAVAKSEPRRETPTPTRTAVNIAAVAATPSQPSRETARSGSSTGREPLPMRQALREQGQWLGSVQAQHAAYVRDLAGNRKEVERIAADASLSALPAARNRNEAAIPAAAALRASAHRDWSRQLDAYGARPAPMQVEQLLKQGESIAFRTSTSTADTQGLVARIRRTPGVAAGGHLGFDSVETELLTTHLRTIPGALGTVARQPYAVQEAVQLRAHLDRGRAELAAQFAAVRRDWLASHARAEELQQAYLRLRAALVAPDAP